MKYLGRIIIAVLLLAPLVDAYAVSPHPDLIRKWKENGTYDKKIAQYDERERVRAFRSAKISPAAKSFPKTGDRRVLVVLVQFAESADAKGGLPFPVFPFAGMFLFAAGTCALVVRFKQNGRFTHGSAGAAVFLMMISVLCVSTQGCGGNSSGSESALFSPVSSKSFYQNLFEGGDDSQLTWRKYFKDMSNNALNLSFDIYGPYTASHNHDYYGANDSYGNDRLPDILAEEAVTMLVNDIGSQVDFSDYDYDEDGYIDSFTIIHQGAGEEVSGSDNDIWSHQFGISGVSSDGVRFGNYAMLPEYMYEPGDSTIGVFCHEFGHILGLPDLYDTSHKTEGVGRWSLMGSGSWNGPEGNGAVPAPLLAWERIIFTWASPDTLIPGASVQTTSVGDLDATFKAVWIPLGDPGDMQYLLAQNVILKPGSWSEYLPGEGLLVSRIDSNYTLSTFLSNNTVNAKAVHGITILEADGRSDLWKGLNRGDSTDLYYPGNATSITPTTVPNTHYTIPGTTNTKATGISITDISRAGSMMTFSYSK